MGPVLSDIHEDWVVHVDYRVRRRRYGETRLLIRNTEYVGIDAASDSVWLACERDLTVGEIIRFVAERHDAPLDVAASATAFALERFHDLGFVTYDTATAPADSQAQVPDT